MLRRTALVLTLLAITASAKAEWIDLGSSTEKAPTWEVTDSDGYGITYDIEIEGFFSDTVTVNDTLYHDLGLYKSPSVNSEGHPNVPFLYKLLCIPESGSIDVEVTVTDSTTLSKYFVYPTEKQVTDTTTHLPEMQFYRIDSLYEGDAYYPDLRGELVNTGQVLIPKTPVYAPEGDVDPWYMRSCMDHQDQIHCVYKNYYGTWNEFNLGYSRVNNQGEVIVPYFPLTPESPFSYCATGHIIADEMDNLHLLYLPNDSGESHQYYRKMDQDLNTLYDIQLVEPAMSGFEIGAGGIEVDGDGNITMVFAFDFSGIELQFKRTTYSTEGIEIISPETIIEDNELIYPDLAVNQEGMVIFNFTWIVDTLPNSKILYSYEVDELPVGSSSGNNTPTNFQLSVFPNPFNPTTTISYFIPDSGQVRLSVYDIEGRMVARLVEGMRNAGSHDVTFDASNLVSGIYLYRLEVGEYSSSRKMALVR